ncbi:unnamed protein product [Linum trigynum]|uniref:Uncharacterized protein n=1 Tax=Linum trigynum TaxID=586398 RepID=A0AAV2GSE7_9ROSI
MFNSRRRFTLSLISAIGPILPKIRWIANKPKALFLKMPELIAISATHVLLGVTLFLIAYLECSGLDCSTMTSSDKSLLFLLRDLLVRFCQCGSGSNAHNFASDYREDVIQTKEEVVESFCLLLFA